MLNITAFFPLSQNVKNATVSVTMPGVYHTWKLFLLVKVVCSIYAVLTECNEKVNYCTFFINIYEYLVLYMSLYIFQVITLFLKVKNELPLMTHM